MNEPVQKFVVETLLFLVGLLVSFGLPWLAWRWLKSRRPSHSPLPIVENDSGGNVVPLIATFSGLRGFPWIGLASNNLNPCLVIEPHGITCRVIQLQTRDWSDILKVDVRSFGATVNLSFVFHGSPFTFDANVGSTVLAVQALSLLSGHVALTDRARSLLAEKS